MQAKTKGQVIYDDYFGHVCTCTAKPGKVAFAGFEGERGEHDWTTYERTVQPDRDSGTETGSYWYSCSRCGAGTWSGM